MLVTIEFWHHTVPVHEFMFYGFHMLQGEVLVRKFKELHLAIVLRVIDDKQVYCVV